jgi:hypothetical protein
VLKYEVCQSKVDGAILKRDVPVFLDDMSLGNARVVHDNRIYIDANDPARDIGEISDLASSIARILGPLTTTGT